MILKMELNSNKKCMYSSCLKISFKNITSLNLKRVQKINYGIFFKFIVCMYLLYLYSLLHKMYKIYYLKK